MKKYTLIKWLLIILVSISVSILIVCLILYFGNKISIGVVKILTPINTFLAAVLAVYNLWYVKRKTESIPEFKYNAWIVSKRKDSASFSNPLGIFLASYITFVFENGLTKELMVPDAYYANTVDGQFGLLTFRENASESRFISFQPYLPPPTYYQQ